MSAGYEVLEHTADIGIRAWGGSLEEAFEQAALGLAELLDARAEGPGETRRVRVEAPDPGALLVDLLNELLVLHESEEVAFAGLRVTRPDSGAVEAEVEVVPVERELESIGVKAATFHQLDVATRPDGSAELRVYLDV